jgi:hypothetical protein
MSQGKDLIKDNTCEIVRHERQYQSLYDWDKDKKNTAQGST